MPILAIDKFGRYYETDPDSSEGDGCKGAVPTVITGDVSFDASISRADDARQLDRAETNAGFAAIDTQEAFDNANERRFRAVQRVRDEEANFNAHKPENLRNLLNAGIKQSQMLNSIVEGNVGLSGNGMTANGLTGKAGMGRQEMGAQIALGLNIFRRQDGSQVIPSAGQVAVADNNPYADQAAITSTSASEQAQYRLKQQTEAKIIKDALLQAKINELEAKAAGYTDEEGEYIDRAALQMTRRSNKTAPQQTTYAQAKSNLPEQTQRVIHPMFLIFLINKPQGA